MLLIRAGRHACWMARVRTREIPLDARERRMIGGGLLVLVLSLGGAAAAFFALWQRKETRAKRGRSRAVRCAVASRETAAGSTTPPRDDGSDDLKVIEGIGPRTEQVLRE